MEKRRAMLCEARGVGFEFDVETYRTTFIPILFIYEKPTVYWTSTYIIISVKSFDLIFPIVIYLQWSILRCMNLFASTHAYNQESYLLKVDAEALCQRYGVKTIIKHERDLSKKKKAELFLLGAEFSVKLIKGVECNVMVYNDELHILSIVEEEKIYYDEVYKAWGH